MNPGAPMANSNPGMMVQDNYYIEQNNFQG